MNGYRSPAKPFSERELDLQRVSDFHAVLLGMAAHDLRQPLQVIQSTYEWLNGRFDAEGDRMRLQRGERAVAGLADQSEQEGRVPGGQGFEDGGLAAPDFSALKFTPRQ